MSPLEIVVCVAFCDQSGRKIFSRTLFPADVAEKIAKSEGLEQAVANGAIAALRLVNKRYAELPPPKQKETNGE